MKGITKALLLIGLAWMAVIGFALAQSVVPPIIIFILLTILFSASLYWLLKTFYISRIKLLNQSIAKISEETSLSKRIKFAGDDQLAGIAEEINQLLDTIQTSQKKLERGIEDRTQELQRSNHRLQKEIADRLVVKETTGKKDFINTTTQSDELTSLPNRAFFNEILNKTISHAKRRDKILAVLLIDIDDFKKINEKLSLAAGDCVLKEMGKRFATVLRSEDILARLDGDEFIVLLNDIGKPKFASAVAEKLLKACAMPVKFDKYEISITTSIGICVYPNDGESLEDLLKNADEALSNAKHAGGARYQFYTSEMGAEAHEYIKLESALRNAIKNNELMLYYQPKLNIKQGAIVGVEALIRWTHPQLGIISPGKMIPLAEESGLMMQIGEWAMREACTMNKYWQNEGYGHLFVSVNLSPKQFQHPDIAKVIAKVLEETQLTPSYLELEISEKTVMEDIEFSARQLAAIKATGVQLSIDHFGSGQTSISHLKEFPITTVKIDQSFIKGIPNNPNDLAIVNAFISLAHNLGFEVVAEGVETAEQVQYLGIQNCDLVQGYFLSHPLPAQKIILQFKKLSEDVLS